MANFLAEDPSRLLLLSQEDVTPAGSMHSEVAPEVVSPPPGPSAELLAVFGRWDRCSSKGIHGTERVLGRWLF